MTTAEHDLGGPSIRPDVAELVLPPGAGRREWLMMRRTGIGGSDASTLVGLSKYTSTTELWMDKSGQLPLIVEATPSEAAEMGTLLEPVVRNRFARVHGVTVELAGTYRSRQWPWMLANPDGLVGRNGYEGKTCNQFVGHEWADGQTADHAELQAQWGMAVTGLEAWHVAVLIGGQHNEYRLIERDDELIEVLVDVSSRFWLDHVKAGVAPEWDGSDAATQFLADRFPSATAGDVDVDPVERDDIILTREKAAAAAKAAVAEENALKNRVRGLIGDADRLMCGDQEIATWRNTGQFSGKKFREQHPDLVAAYTHSVTTAAIDTVRLADEHPDVYRGCRARRLDFKS